MRSRPFVLHHSRRAMLGHREDRKQILEGLRSGFEALQGMLLLLGALVWVCDRVCQRSTESRPGSRMFMVHVAQQRLGRNLRGQNHTRARCVMTFRNTKLSSKPTRLARVPVSSTMLLMLETVTVEVSLSSSISVCPC